MYQVKKIACLITLAILALTASTVSPCKGDQKHQGTAQFLPTAEELKALTGLEWKVYEKTINSVDSYGVTSYVGYKHEIRTPQHYISTLKISISYSRDLDISSFVKCDKKLVWWTCNAHKGDYFIRCTGWSSHPDKYKISSITRAVLRHIINKIGSKKPILSGSTQKDAIKFIDSYPSDGAKISVKKTKIFHSTIFYSLVSEDRGTIKVQAIALLEGGTQKVLGEEDVPATKGPNKKTKIKIPLDIPPKTEKIVFIVKLILEKGGYTGIYDLISAIPWVPANVKLITPDRPIVANGKETYLFKVKVEQEGKPIKGVKVEIWPQPSSHDFMTYPKFNKGDGVLNLTTDETGIASFYYTPPRILPDKLPVLPKKISLTFPLLIKSPGFAKSRVWNVPLYPPHPRIRSVRISELSAGDWQKAESIIEVEDPDSNSFIYTIIFQGDIGWKEGHKNHKKLVADCGKTLTFRLRPIKFGLDLQNLPDLFKKLWETNVDFIRNELFNLTVLRLNKRELFEKSLKGLEISKLSLDISGPGKDVAGTITAYKTAPANIKNASDTLGLTIKGYNTTVGVIDYINSWVDKGPYDPYSTALKLIYENAKAFYDVFEAHRRVAEAYEDVIFLPIIVRVKDPDGYEDIKIRDVAVRFWKR